MHQGRVSMHCIGIQTLHLWKTEATVNLFISSTLKHLFFKYSTTVALRQLRTVTLISPQDDS